MTQPMDRNARSDGGGAYELARVGANESAPARRLPAARQRRRAVRSGHRRLGGRAPVPGSGGQEVVGGDSAHAREEDAEGGRQGRC